MEWLPSLPVARRKPVSSITKFPTAFPMLQFLSEPALHGAEILHSVISQPFWQSSRLMFGQQEKLPARRTTFVDQWQNNIVCWSSRSSVLTRQSRRVAVDFSSLRSARRTHTRGGL